MTKYAVQISKALADDPPALRHYIEWHSGLPVVGDVEVRHVTVAPEMAAAFPDHPAETWYATADVGVST